MSRGPAGLPHQHSEQQRLDLRVRQHLLVQQHVGLGHGHLPQVRVSDPLRLYGDTQRSRSPVSRRGADSRARPHLSRSRSQPRAASWGAWSSRTPSRVSLVLWSLISGGRSSSWCLEATRQLWNSGEFCPLACSMDQNRTQELLGVRLRGLAHVQAHGLACPGADLAHRGVVGRQVALRDLRRGPRLSLPQGSGRAGSRRRSGRWPTAPVRLTSAPHLQLGSVM